ncbi:CDP-glucose 4,6-dehydratase [Akkermansiaceae bacterium]|nr:CDP-glucose 4,6-dehydratase [Akkermansiaceae bacterium]
MFGDIYKGKTVLVTGHTGFKGSWLCEWLLSLGANVVGYALDPQPHELLFNQLNLSDRLAEDHRADILDREKLTKIVKESQPDIILHLAAQPLVQLSYDIPVETIATNVMGTTHLLDAVRLSGHSCAVVAITTDKCYENQEWLHAYREEDSMGGHDPYSASKGAAELVIASYRNSFFSSGAQVSLASARAGNVIGGGDWAKDRIVPDCVRALKKGESIPVRNKTATRPWQHVLEPLSGYLWLGAMLNEPELTPQVPREALLGGFNFGPNLTSNQTVADLVQEILQHIPGEWTDESDPHARHEAGKLNLALDKAFHLLQWQPVWGFGTTVQKTVQWYVDAQTSGDIAGYTQSQIQSYTNDAQNKGVTWSNH